MGQVKRRDFVKQAGALAAGFGLGPGALVAERAPSYNEKHPDMLVRYISTRLNALAEKWDGEREKIKTAAQMEARNRFVREKVREMIHGLPEPVPLNAVTVRTFERKGYRVENVMFQSRPNFWVTGNLYIPTGRTGPFPGIISPCGHYPEARMEPEYQFAYMSMVLSGFVVLAYDPIGQGERRQYWNPQTKITEVAPYPTYEHSMPGQVLFLMGEDLTHYFIADGMRAVDYLLARPEVDKGKIGCAGHSGGATVTGYLACIDERIQCAVVNQGGTGHRWPANPRPGGSLGPSDVEQNVFPAAAHGVDTCDRWAAIAPRPLLVTIENYGAAFNHSAGHVKARYELFGVPQKFATEEANDPHSWTMKLRLATTDWFCRWFYDRRGPDREPNFEPEPLELLHCMPNGSLRYSQHGESIFSLMIKKGDRLTPQKAAPSTRAGLDSFRREIAGELRKLIRYDGSAHPLDPRHIVTTPRRGYKVENIEFLSEPGIHIPAWVFVPDKRDGGPPLVFVHEDGKEAEGLEFGRLEALARKGRLVVSVDVRGVGETEPRYSPGDRGNPFEHLFNAETGLAYMAWYMDRSLFGMRVRDVVRSVDYALSRPDANARSVRVVGKGEGALWTLFAAALDERIASVVAENSLVSYRSLTAVDRYTHGAAIFVPDILKHFDLPQVAGSLAGRELVLVSPVDPMKRPIEIAAARRAYAWTEQAFRGAGAAERFRIAGQFEL